MALTKQYKLQSLDVIPPREATDEEGNPVTVPHTFGYAYVMRVVDGATDEIVSESQPHRGTFQEGQEAHSFAIAADGTTKTGQEILDEAGIAVSP